MPDIRSAQEHPAHLFSSAVRKHFADLSDPRVSRTRRYTLCDLLLIALCAVVCGADGFVAIQEWGQAKADWLCERFGVEAIPSHDTFGRVFALLDPYAFAACFAAWTADLHEKTKGEVIALDGKTVRSSMDAASGKAALHLVSAWATGSGLSLAQRAVDGKSNEITALPELLGLLDLEGCIVTADAMGCQKEVARLVQEKGGDYVLALKGNHPNLHESVRRFFEQSRQNEWRTGFGNVAHRHCWTQEKGHGRIEIRRCWVVDTDIAWLDPDGQWAGLASVAAVECERRVGAGASAKTTVEVRYFLSSLRGSARQVLRAVRRHWGIENNLHWTLDLAFREDESRVRKDHAGENLATLRKLALNLLKRETTAKVGIAIKRAKAGWDNQYLAKILVS